MLCIWFVLCTLGVLVTGTSVNYCGSRMCGNTNAHTFCQFSEGPSPRCVGYIKAPLSVEEKSRVMARLNRRRNEAAAGYLRGMPSAGNMLKLRWVEELAREAQRWADQCRPARVPEEHDVCRDLYSIPVGQCVASVVGEAPGLRVESMIDMWYMQNLLYKGNITYYIPPTKNSSFYGDFGQILWSRSYMVGCGRSRFMAPWNGRLRSVERLVCNLAPHGPVPYRPLWVPAEPVTNCPPRAIPDRGFNALCNFQKNVEEISFIETSMSLEEHILLNTVLEIENNRTLDYLGSLDEIYLTQLAIVTIENTETTQGFYNSIQRRNADMVELEEANVAANNLTIDTEIGQALNISNKLEIKRSEPAKITKKKVSLVGRPKSYKIEDLTSFDKVENLGIPTEDLSKREKEFYSEYDFLESEENTTVILESVTVTENVTAVTEFLILNEDVNRILNADVINEHFNVSLEGPINAVKVNLSTWSLTNEITVNKLNTTQDIEANFDNGTLRTVPDKAMDDYLSDPETVRQLQDALDRMERTMETQQSTERQGKVRREIRKLPPLDNPRNPINDALHKEEVERNKTLARGPMMNMVFKYMPYFKEYEGGILGKSTDGVDRLSSYVPLVLLLYVIV